MPIYYIFLILIVIGVLVWLVNKYIPMQPWAKKLFNVVAAIIVIIWLLDVLGVLHILKSAKI